MPIVAVIGGQWGDEGKGKIVDMLAQRAHTVVRFSGGSNAGHTVVNPLGTFRLHLIPSGIFNPDCTCIIATGVVLDPEEVLQEIELLEEAGVKLSKLKMSARANVVMPYHRLLDALEEKSRGGSALGTTRRGIGPAYADRAARLGIRVGDLLDRSALLHRLRIVLEQKNTLLTKVYGVVPLSLEEMFDQLGQYGRRLAPFICETETLLLEALEQDGNVLFEGSQGTLLDIDFGTYPYVTSAPTCASGVFVGAGISPRRIDTTLGVFKAYVTRVGAGPLPTELLDEVGHHIRERANEYGATTGRPRRCGWFDAVAARYSARVNGFNSLGVTRLDVLDELPTLKVCTAYKLDGATIESFPSSAHLLERCEPVYEELPGWQANTTKAAYWKELPRNARAYIRRLEELVGCRVGLISVGAERESTITLRDPFKARRS